MRAERWGGVRRGQYLIFADAFEGVFKALVKDVDLRIQDSSEPGGFGYPYGLTVESGAVEVEVAGERRILNLVDLIPWSSGTFSSLAKQWREIVAVKGELEAKEEVFTAGVNLLKAS